jgi:hypothetical protein
MVAFDDLNPTQFEEFCADLLRELGFINVDWRKGTDLSASPADQGRDIQAELLHTEVDESARTEKWFVDCKHYRRGVPPEALQGLLSWAEAERPDVALVIASGFLSNPAKEYLVKYEQNRRPPFRIKYWERPILERLTENRDDLLQKYLLADPGVRSQSEIIAAEQEFFDRVWYDRHQSLMSRVEEGKESIDPKILARAKEAAAQVQARYGDEALGPYDDFEWGMINGKLSALRWVLGEDWDFLDT